MRPGLFTLLLIKSARCALSGALSVAPSAVTLKGWPLRKLMMLLICQPPARYDSAPPLLSHLRPLPNGNSVMFVICRLCVRSKLLSERFRLKYWGMLMRSPLSLSGTPAVVMDFDQV